MAKKNDRRIKRIRTLILVCVLTLSSLVMSAYAWFIGMKTVNVSAFEVEVASTEGLYLSMDGENWSYSLDAKNTAAYVGNTNTWAEDGLIPMSTIGEMSKASSRMILFEKGSLTATSGGYRLLTSQVDNSAAEQKGYVAFDLFVKNISGHAYYAEDDIKTEEAIYLTTNSKVTIAQNGGKAGTGIENSVRVAFTQVGRVKADTSNVGTITGMTCTTAGAVTGLCHSAKIWEPNDTAHVQNAINWYDASCRTRKAAGTVVSDPASFNSGTHCAAVNTTNLVEGATPTYAISRALNVNDNVDVYDGAEYNTYTANTKTYAEYQALVDKTEAKLVKFPYFTDTMKLKEGNDRPTFMTLAPNSITKVRIYVYIEGQDIDNYDFASLGNKISINFGFTKERYIESDVDYNGPALPATNPSVAD